MSTFRGHRRRYTYSVQAYPLTVFGERWICPKLAGRMHDIVEVARTRNPNRLKLFGAQGLLGLARRVHRKETP